MPGNASAGDFPALQAEQLNRIDALVYTENTRSVRLLERLSFQREGLLREYFSVRGRYFDHATWSVLKNGRERR